MGDKNYHACILKSLILEKVSLQRFKQIFKKLDEMMSLLTLIPMQ